MEENNSAPDLANTGSGDVAGSSGSNSNSGGTSNTSSIGIDSGRSPRSRADRRILADSQIQSLCGIADHMITLRYIYEEYGITKRELLRSYVAMEIESSPYATGTLVNFLERNFPEDIRTAVIREGQERAAEMMDVLAGEIFALNVAVTELIAELRESRTTAEARVRAKGAAK